jgi:hypothetical protein
LTPFSHAHTTAAKTKSIVAVHTSIFIVPKPWIDATTPVFAAAVCGAQSSGRLLHPNPCILPLIVACFSFVDPHLKGTISVEKPAYVITLLHLSMRKCRGGLSSSERSARLSCVTTSHVRSVKRAAQDSRSLPMQRSSGTC